MLQGIEATIVSAWALDPSINDEVVALAIHGALTRDPHDDPRVNDLAAGLLAERQEHDVTDLVWAEALRIVRDSVHRHQKVEPGERSYLEFIAKYIE